MWTRSRSWWWFRESSWSPSGSRKFRYESYFVIGRRNRICSGKKKAAWYEHPECFQKHQLLCLMGYFHLWVFTLVNIKHFLRDFFVTCIHFPLISRKSSMRVVLSFSIPTIQSYVTRLVISEKPQQFLNTEVDFSRRLISTVEFTWKSRALSSGHLDKITQRPWLEVHNFYLQMFINKYHLQFWK